MACQIEQVTLPAAWAGFLINGDASDLFDGEAAHIRRYLEGMGACVSCADDAHYTNCFAELSGHFIAPGYDAPPRSGEVLEYSFIRD